MEERDNGEVEKREKTEEKEEEEREPGGRNIGGTLWCSGDRKL